MKRALAIAVTAGLVLTACAESRRLADTAAEARASLLPEDRLALPEFDLAR